MSFAMTSAVAAVRAFNRFYTRQVGVLERHLMGSPFSLTEARVIYELAQRPEQTAGEIGVTLGLDAGYLSRMLRNFSADGLLAKRPSPTDARQQHLALTAKGRAAAAKLARAADAEAATMLAPLSAADTNRLVAAMATIERLLRGVSAAEATLRAPLPGDMGFVVQSHGALYAAEYGYDSSFEALVAEIVANFIKYFDASRERCWIAELDGRPVGSLFLVKASDDVAKLRLMLIDPAARGQGLGARLINEAIDFARHCGYRRITLWTQSHLIAARKLYQNAGFALVGSEPHRSFGQDLIGETWEREIREMEIREREL
uniref:Transcriptional regulator, MarR family with acetyltransferase activity n=1 Tax=Rhodopseudomonas palustris (strain BisA53) TaxID=316055 RepID=Q07I83_RHOP5